MLKRIALFVLESAETTFLWANGWTRPFPEKDEWDAPEGYRGRKGLGLTRRHAVNAQKLYTYSRGPK